MAQSFSLDPADLHAVAPSYAAGSARLRSAHAALKATLDGLGAPWGDDEQGRQFASSFAPNAQKLDQVLEVLVTGLASIDPALRSMADNVGDAGRASTVRAD